MARRRAIFCIGLDVQSIEEVQESIDQFGDHYTRRVFTAHEIESSTSDQVTRASSLAGRFAAKEAVLKVLEIGDRAVPMRSIEVWRPENRRPIIRLSGVAAELANKQGFDEFSLSLSHSGGVAAAAVLAHSSSRSRWSRR